MDQNQHPYTNNTVYNSSIQIPLIPGGSGFDPNVLLGHDLEGANDDLVLFPNVQEYAEVGYAEGKNRVNGDATGYMNGDREGPYETFVRGPNPTPNTDCTSPIIMPDEGSGNVSVKAMSPTLEQFDDGYVKEKKKAQNRAAQKAFRERKEARLKELEQRLKESEENRDALNKEMEELKKQNFVIHNENRILMQRKGSSLPGVVADPEKERFTFPPKDDSTELQREIEKELSAGRDAVRYVADGKKLLTVPATWEYLHELSLDKDIDVYLIMQKLKGTEVCHGYGPAYTRARIDSLVEECLQSNSNKAYQ
ncbi:Yap3p Ecym_2430 [Eremothecium cymbalariae DBVPG|uniref:BZIP domain-containing protein n=1 Tax=Eremothecium cymbalariae (strain CBS 270.75 / DBVPG 7215 / KCTC 17166 / NRRL Y-17582) TaxID=931890 RepID=G8JPA2_ERECY|nr:Hypothetical protein Ecym_2430 [Eremothecium cymbalariae DBVPG\